MKTVAAPLVRKSGGAEKPAGNFGFGVFPFVSL
jgi:hypothetical protein